MSTVKITISGEAGSGKSTIACKLFSLLQSKGVTCILEDPDIERIEDAAFYSMYEEELFSSIAKKTAVKIEVVQLRRLSLTDAEEHF